MWPQIDFEEERKKEERRDMWKLFDKQQRIKERKDWLSRTKSGAAMLKNLEDMKLAKEAQDKEDRERRERSKQEANKRKRPTNWRDEHFRNFKGPRRELDKDVSYDYLARDEEDDLDMASIFDINPDLNPGINVFIFFYT